MLLLWVNVLSGAGRLRGVGEGGGGGRERERERGAE